MFIIIMLLIILVSFVFLFSFFLMCTWLGSIDVNRAGELRVYVKVESQQLETVSASFVRAGDRGQRWRQGYVALANITENFQVRLG